MSRHVAALKAHLATGSFAVAPGVFDGLSAHLARRAGFPFVYASGGAIARSMGLPDLGLVTMTEMADRLRQIVAAADLPVIADADTGHGAPVNVFRMAGEFARTGVAAIHIEDQGFPKRCGHIVGKTLVSADEMCRRLRAARRGLEETGQNLCLIARTDAITVEGFEAAVARAQRYVAAGADMIFVEAPESTEQITAIPRRIAAPHVINMFKGGRSPFTDADTLANLGYNICIVPSDLQRACLRAMSEILADIRATGDSRRSAALLSPFGFRDEAVEASRWEEIGME